MSEYGSLLGRQVLALQLNADKTLLVLQFSDGTQQCLSAVGDCCSSSWIEHIENVESLLSGIPIQRVESRDVEDYWQDDEGNRLNGESEVYGENIQVYTLDIHVMGKQPCRIEYRNSSNGYYGGWLALGEIPRDQYGDPRSDVGALLPLLSDF